MNSHAEKKIELMRHATTIVEDEGWAALSIAALAAKSGASRQWIHRIFGGIESLKAHLVDYLLEEWYDSCLHIMAERLSFDETVRRYFEALVDANAYMLAAIRAMFANADPLTAEPHTDGRKDIADLWAPLWHSENLRGEAETSAATEIVFWGSIALAGLVQAEKLEREPACKMLVKMARGALANP